MVVMLEIKSTVLLKLPFWNLSKFSVLHMDIHLTQYYLLNRPFYFPEYYSVSLLYIRSLYRYGSDFGP